MSRANKTILDRTDWAFIGATFADDRRNPAPATCTPERGANHCWHENGRSVTDGMGDTGRAEGQCCHCGEMFWRNWRVVTQAVSGHGPHITERIVEYQP